MAGPLLATSAVIAALALSTPAVAQTAQEPQPQPPAQATDPTQVEEGPTVSPRIGEATLEGRQPLATEGQGEQAAGPPLHITNADEITGSEVRNRQGESLGNIEQVIVDIDSGRVTYAILGVGGFLGIGDKSVAVPWQALEVSPREGEDFAFLLDADRQRLENAPSVNRDDLQSMANQEMAESIYAYYGVRTYWMDGAAPQQAEQQPAGTQPAPPPAGQPEPQPQPQPQEPARQPPAQQQ